MKLATYKDGSRDGQLLVVSRDLSAAHYATGIASRLQHALDDWNFIAPQLQDLYDTLNSGKARHAFAFDAAQCMAPLPRAYLWAECQAWPPHAELLRAAGGAHDMGEADDTAMHLCASGDLLGPRALLMGQNDAWQIDFAAGLAAATGEVPCAATPEQGLDAVRLLMLSCATVLHAPPAAGPLHRRPATALSPVAVTPDELGDAWQGGRVHLTLQASLNGRRLGLCEAGADMRFHFGQLIAHAARTHRLRAGSLIGAGPVSNAGTENNGRREWPRGHVNLAEKRAAETLLGGAPKTAYLHQGDTVRIDMKGRAGESVFGTIEQRVGLPETTER
ncbi:MAG: fumarylacetoacetate hydrolase family protein [Pseudomonadota bacterium]|nr:fumarylacetoacetate hydrolase family protein [Pseudomonadota bacterium]